jgi:nucleotide-binding universal stress UspA family protein
MSTRDEPNLTALPRRILVPIDGDPPTGPAFDQAASLAVGLGAELVLLGVTTDAFANHPVPSALAIAPDEVAADRNLIEGKTRERLREAQDRVPSGVRSRAVMSWSPEGPAIVKAAREEAADLIVVGMRRGGELAHMFRDGADRHVLHHSPVPVLVVPAP